MSNNSAVEKDKGQKVSKKDDESSEYLPETELSNEINQSVGPNMKMEDLKDATVTDSIILL